MKVYALVVDGIVREIIQPAVDDDGNEIPVSDRYHPDIVAMLVEVTEETTVPQQGYVYDGSTFSAPAALGPVIPQVVTAAQGGIALIQAGKMDAVQAAVDAADTPAEVKWAWERAQNWERSSAALAYLAQRAGITDTEMDALFVTASSIVA